MNTFGTSTLQFPLCDARGIRALRTRFRRPMLPELPYANNIYIPTGRWRTRGWVILDRQSYKQLPTYSTSLQLNIGDPTQPDNVKTLQNLSIVYSQCITRGLTTDANSLYLIELTDDRGILHNEWFQAPLTKSYNIRAPSYPQTFHTWSMNGGTTWTWSTMLQDMWNTLNTINSGVLGLWPGLPTTPVGTPEGFWFQGVPGWWALNDVIEYLGMTIACDLTQANPFTIVVPGNTDSTFINAQTKYATNLEDDLDWIDTGAGRAPLNVTVLFRRRNSVYGSEETVTYRNDSTANQWESTPLYKVTFTAPALFANAVGVHYLWSDFTIRYDQDGNPLAADTATASTIAQDRTTQYFNKIYRQTSGLLTQTYTGALPFTTGTMVDGVRWYMDSDGDGGWRTDIVRGGYPPWDNLWPDIVGGVC